MGRTQYTDPVTRLTVAAGVNVLEPLQNVQVTVFKVKEDGTREAALPPLYAARTGGALFAAGNPFVTPAGGQMNFWLDNGDYDLDFHDLNLPARIGDQTTSVQAISGADNGIKLVQLPEYGRGVAQPGFMELYGGAADPAGWFLCDGRVLSQATYAALYAAIGNLYNIGGEGAGNFRLPDYRGRSPLGPDDMGTAAGPAGRLTSLTAGQRVRGQVGGSDTNTLSAAQLPVHDHNATAASATTGVSTQSAGSHSHGGATGAAGDHTHGLGGTNGFIGGVFSGGSGGWESTAGTNSLNNLAVVGATGTVNGGAHAHSIGADGSHGHTMTDPGHTHVMTVNDSGKTRGQAHNNLHPYQISPVIIKF